MDSIPGKREMVAASKLDPGVICTLSEKDLGERMAWIRDEILPHAHRTERLESGFAWDLVMAPGLAAKLDRLIALERECCSGIVFERSEASVSGRLRLEVRGIDPEAPVFRALHAQHDDGHTTGHERECE